MARVGISQDVPNAAKRHAQQARAQADIAAAEANGFVEVRRVKVATALAWIDLYYAERRIAAIDAVIARQNGLAVAAHSGVASGAARPAQTRSEEPTSEIQSIMRYSYPVLRLKKQKNKSTQLLTTNISHNQ